MAVYLVTGGSRGLGLEFVRQLRARGETVIAAVRTPGSAPEAARLAEVVRLDQTDAQSIAAMAEQLSGRAIDVLINNAAVGGGDGSIEHISQERMREIFVSNVTGPALVTRALLPNLRAGSRKMIWNISSTAGSIGGGTSRFSYSYSMSKAALNKLTVFLADELRAEGFTVLSLCPGWTRTDMGGASAPLEPAQSVGGLLKAVQGVSVRESGRFINHEGKPVAW